MPLIHLDKIVKDFPGVRALDGVSFSVRAGEIHALVGENGAGKSTLIKILGGIWPDGSFSGALTLDSQPLRLASVHDAEAAGIAVITQELALVPEMSVAENISLGIEPGRFGLVDREAEARVAIRTLGEIGVHLDLNARVGDLGIGQRQMVEIARALARNFTVLVLDEPTAALSEREVGSLLDLLRRLRLAGKAVIYISHRLNEVLDVADTVTVLRDGRSVGTMIRRDVDERQIIRLMVGRDLDTVFPPRGRTPGAVRLAVEDLCLSMAGGRRKILEGIHLNVRAGEIVGIAGLVGSGRSELLRSIFGLAPGTVSGRLSIDGVAAEVRHPSDAVRHGIGMVPEDRRAQGLVPWQSVAFNTSLVDLARFCRLGWVNSGHEASAVDRHCTALGVKASSWDAPVALCSGGNQQKVVIAKWLMTSMRVLLLDEPTRGIDVGAKAEMYELIARLAADGMAVLLVSSELSELLGLCDRIMTLAGGRITGEFNGPDAGQEELMAAMT